MEVNLGDQLGDDFFDTTSKAWSIKEKKWLVGLLKSLFYERHC